MSISEIMPSKVRRSLAELGQNIRTARLRRRITVEMMLERTGMSKATYRKVEQGDPMVAVGSYAMCLLALGFGTVLGEIAAPQEDETALMMDRAKLPQRVRLKKDALGPEVR